MPAHSPKTYAADRPALRMPAELDRPSGTLDTKIATTATQLTAPPASIDVPMTIDSGIPSSSAPTAMAVPLPGCSSSDACCFPDRLRWSAPKWDSDQLAAV